jgi:hypothetical protein
MYVPPEVFNCCAGCTTQLKTIRHKVNCHETPVNLLADDKFAFKYR